MNISAGMLLSSLATLLVVFQSAAPADDSFTFSGCVKENVGCLKIVPQPIKNAAITIYDNQACIIDGMSNQMVYFSYSGRLTSYRVTSDSAGNYRFENCDADSFICYQMKMNQIVEAAAEGYYPQRRDMVPEQDLLLDFDLLETARDSFVQVTVMVVAVDTTGSNSPVPLKNYRIEIPNRYLPWFSPQVKDTTDQDGKAVFPLSIVPYVDYRIVAKSLNGDNRSGEIVSNIASCMGNNVTIRLHIPGAGIQRDRMQGKGSKSVEWFHHRSGSGMALSVRIAGREYRQEVLLLHIFDMKGKSVGCYKVDAGREIADHGRLFTFKTNDLPAGMYLLKMNSGKRVYSEKIILNR
jgi:hypothetical protein